MVVMEEEEEDEEEGRGDKRRRKKSKGRKGNSSLDFCALTYLEEQVFDGYLLCPCLVHWTRIFPPNCREVKVHMVSINWEELTRTTFMTLLKIQP